MSVMNQRECYARAEAYWEAATHLGLDWTHDNTEREQGEIIAKRLFRLQAIWLRKGRDAVE